MAECTLGIEFIPAIRNLFMNLQSNNNFSKPKQLVKEKEKLYGNVIFDTEIEVLRFVMCILIKTTYARIAFWVGFT